MEIVDTLGFLLGTWNVMRSMEDHQSGTRGSFEGTATLTEMRPAGDSARGRTARFEEAGELHFGTHTGQAHRRLEYVQLDNATVMLYFADGRPFVDLDLRTGAWRSCHPCADDRYEIATFVRSRDLMEERWRVRGPTTSYDAVSTLTRAG